MSFPKPKNRGSQNNESSRNPIDFEAKRNQRDRTSPNGKDWEIGFDDEQEEHEQEPKSERDQILALVQAMAHQDIQRARALAYALVSRIAALDDIDQKWVTNGLKAILGGSINLNSFKAEIRKAYKRANPPRKATDGTLPVIDITNAPLRDLSEQSTRALLAQNAPPFLFVRDSDMVRIVHDENGVPGIAPMNDATMRGHLSRAADFIKSNEKGETHVFPPLDVVRDVLAMRATDFPPLVAITQSPVLRQDGTVFATPGYDPVTRLVYAPAPGFTMPAIPAYPTQEDIRQAVDVINDILWDFPFKTEADKAN